MAAWAATLSQGAIGRALGFLPEGDEKGPLEALRRKAYVLVDAALSEGSAAGYSAALSYSPAGARKLMHLFAFVEEWLRDFGAVASGAGDAVFNHDARSRLEEIVSRSGIAASDLTLAMSAVEEARELARGNVNPQLVIRRLDPRYSLSGSAPASRGAYSMKDGGDRLTHVDEEGPRAHGRRFPKGGHGPPRDCEGAYRHGRGYACAHRGGGRPERQRRPGR